MHVDNRRRGSGVSSRSKNVFSYGVRVRGDYLYGSVGSRVNIYKADGRSRQRT